MTKILTGSAISYGAILPSSAAIADGTLFFLTTEYTDAANSPTNPSASPISRTAGLHLFSFRQDVNSSIIGDQVGFGWKQLSSLDTYLSTSGGTVSGPLTISTSTDGALFIQGPTPGIRFRETDQAAGNKEWLVVADGASFQLQTRDDSFATPVTVLAVNRFGVGQLFGSTIWTAGNDGASSGLDADLLDGLQGAYYLNSANHTGSIPVSRGGTNATTVVAGGVVYGANTGAYGSVAGTAGQVLISNGAAAPTWVNTNTLTSSSAATLTPGRTIAISGAVTGSAFFDGSANISIITTGASIPWTAISGLPTASQTFAVGASGGAQAFNVIARPSLFYDVTSGAGTLPTPTQHETSSISGFDGYSTSDGGQYQVGFTAMGSAGAGSRAVQIAANWNFEEAAPTGLRYRVNDDTSTTGAWGAWTTLIDTTSFSGANFVSKGPAGDTMAGSLTLSNAGTAVIVNGISLNHTNSLINTSGAINAGTTINAGSTIQAIGTVTARASVGGSSSAVLHPGGGGVTGAIDFYSVIGREGYIGRGPSVASADSGTIKYVAGNHEHTGQLVMNAGSNIVLNGGFTQSSLTYSTLSLRGTQNGGTLTITCADGPSNATDFNSASSGSTYQFRLNGNTRLSVADTVTNVTGNFVASGNVTAFSDRRLKENIAPITNALQKVQAITGVTFDRVDHLSARQTGVIAQEVQAVLPEAVLETESGMLSVAYGNMVGLLIEAIKEQQQQIDALRRQVSSMVK